MSPGATSTDTAPSQNDQRAYGAPEDRPVYSDGSGYGMVAGTSIRREEDATVTPGRRSGGGADARDGNRTRRFRAQVRTWCSDA